MNHINEHSFQSMCSKRPPPARTHALRQSCHCFDCCSTSVQCLLVCVSVCEYVFVCVLLLFFTDCRIHLFSSLAARLFNKLTRYWSIVSSIMSWSKWNKVCIKRFRMSSTSWIVSCTHCCITPQISNFKAYDDHGPLWWSYDTFDAIFFGNRPL